jgi:hypothetical protein
LDDGAEEVKKLLDTLGSGGTMCSWAAESGPGTKPGDGDRRETMSNTNETSRLIIANQKRAAKCSAYATHCANPTTGTWAVFEQAEREWTMACEHYARACQPVETMDDPALFI